jgi:hypothetical protein
MAATPTAFKFRKNDRIGSAGAEEDDEYLRACFVDTGGLELLEDPSDNRVIVLGRTGAGKTALLRKLKRDRPDRVIEIHPENLALTYVSNSTVLSFFGAIGVNLDPFFTLLWRHVLTIEILSRHLEHGPQNQQKSLLERLSGLFSGNTKKDKDHREAVQYLKEWGESFWQETEYRVKEITKKIETDLSSEFRAALGGKAGKLSLNRQAAEALSIDEKAELLSRGQDVVSKAQVRDLKKVLDLLDTVLEDRQKQYFVVVDALDENWVEDRLRYKLIMALIVTARDFIRIRNAKLIIALRRDLIDRVFRLMRDSGFQEEKYQSLYLPLTWSRSDILEVLDKRVGYLVSRRYTSAPASYRDLLPKDFRSVPIGEYLFGIAKRPRDIIAFFNTCIAGATDQPKLTAKQLAVAEGEYSRSRLRALADEWAADFPELLDFAVVLNKRTPSFKIGSVTDNEIAETCLQIVSKKPEGVGTLHAAASLLVDGNLSALEFKFSLFHVFYKVGMVGLKLAADEGASWADDLGQAISHSQLSSDTSVVVAPAFARALGIKDRTAL